MKQSLSSLMAFIVAILFIGTAYAATSNATQQRTLEVASVVDQIPPVSQPTVLERVPLGLGDIDGFVVKLFALDPDSYIKPNAISESDSVLNLLDMDELWVTYRAPSDSRNCILSGKIRALSSPLSAETSDLPPDVPISLSSGGQKKQGDKIILDEKVLPRDVNYLIRRQIGMYDNTGWRMIGWRKYAVIMHLLRIDMHHISVIEFEMDSAVERVNFRLSRKASGKPTDTLEWQDIPKDIIKYGSKQRVRLDFASVIQQNLPGTLGGSSPLNLVEIIVFIKKGAITNDTATIKQLDSYYETPSTAAENLAIRALSRSEEIAPNLWRWRMRWASLQKLSLNEAVFTDGQITLDKSECITSLEEAELVSLPPQTMPAVKPDTQNSTRTLQSAPLPIDVAVNLYLRWLKLAVFIAFSAWVFMLWQRGTLLQNVLALRYRVLILWRCGTVTVKRNVLALWNGVFILWLRGAVQRNVLALWNWVVRLSGELFRFWDVQENLFSKIFVAHRQGLNLLLLLVVLIYGLLSSGKYSIVNPSIGGEQIGLLIFSAFVALHAWRWRWHVQFALSRQVDIKSNWLVAQGKWPPLMVWALTGVIILITLIMQWQAYIPTVGDQKFLTNLAASDVGSALEMLILREGLAIIEQGEFVPLLLAFGYGFLPWLYMLLILGARFVLWMLLTLGHGFLPSLYMRLFSAMHIKQRIPAVYFEPWVLVVLLFYGVGLKDIGQPGQNYFFIFGGMATVVAWSVWMKRSKRYLEQYWSTLAEKIYGSAGGIYFSGALVALVIAVLISIIRLELIAEQVAVVVYYCLVVGTVFEIEALKGSKKDMDDKSSVSKG